MVIVVIIYLYIILHDLIWINFELNWLKHGHFFIVQNKINWQHM